MLPGFRAIKVSKPGETLAKTIYAINENEMHNKKIIWRKITV